MRMEQSLGKPLPYVHIKDAARKALTYIYHRKNDLIKPLKTQWPKLNKICNGGIEPGQIMAILGISGSGKSSIANSIETNLIDLNPDEDVVVLSFTFEMLSSRQIGRKISSKMRKSTAELYSADEKISDDIFKTAVEKAKDLSEYPIYYVDGMAEVSGIAETIKWFQETIAKDKWLVVILDHALLIKGGSERSNLIELMSMFIQAKKVGKTSVILISQMNRGIESPERINNPSAHYPMRSDMSSSDAIYQGSDIVVVIHRPETLGITAYGPRRLITKDKVYLHVIKNRDGEVGILVFKNDLKYNNIIEDTVAIEDTAQTKLEFTND
jgi:replicative DNA helicase